MRAALRRPVVGGALALGLLASVGVSLAGGPTQALPTATDETSATAGSSSSSASQNPGGQAVWQDADRSETKASREKDRESKAEWTKDSGSDEKPVSEQDYSAEELKIIREDPKPWGRELAREAGWSDKQWMCLHDLWVGESDWEFDAKNPTSGAYGIPQSLPADKMDRAGSDWRSNPITQMEWGIEYIEKSYGTPCEALEFWHSKDPHWY